MKSNWTFGLESRFIIHQITAADCLEGLTSWSEFYHDINKWRKRYGLNEAIRIGLINYLDKYLHQVSIENEVSKTGFSQEEYDKLLPLFQGYYQENIFND